MTWQEAVAMRTEHPRFAWLCSDDNPDTASREAYRALVLRMAEPPSYPPLWAQAMHALGALWRVVRAAVKRHPVKVDEAEVSRRRAICAKCEMFDSVARKCTECGCVERWKARLATEDCRRWK